MLTTNTLLCSSLQFVLFYLKKTCSYIYIYFLAFDFWRFCVIIRFFIPATTANDLRLRRISIPDLILYIFCPYIFCTIFILQKEPVFHCLMLSAKQGNYSGRYQPRTSRTQSQHYTTRLSRRWLISTVFFLLFVKRLSDGTTCI